MIGFVCHIWSWIQHIKAGQNNRQRCCYLRNSSDMDWSISVSRACVDCLIPQFAVLPTTTTSISELQAVPTFVNRNLPWNADPQFAPVTAKEFLKISLVSDHLFDKAYIKCVLQVKLLHTMTFMIHHSSCEWFLPEKSDDICHICKGYKRSYLNSKLISIRDEQLEAACEVGSHVNLSKLDTPQRYKRLGNQHTTIVKQKKQIKSLQEKL